MTRIPESTIGANVRTLRERAGMSKAQLARTLTEEGAPTVPQTVANIEAGTRKVLLSEAVILADVFGVKITDVAGAPDRRRRTSPPPPPPVEPAPHVAPDPAPKPLGYAVVSHVPHPTARAAYEHARTLPVTRRRHVVALFPAPRPARDPEGGR